MKDGKDIATTMKYAVTLASGQLGGTIIKKLTSQVGAENVIGIARTPAKAAHLGVEIRKGDYNVKADFDSALKGVDRLLIVSNTGDPEVRKEQHRNIVQAAEEACVSKIVYVSIVGETADTSFAPIVASNRVTENDVQTSGLVWAIGRNGIYIEPDLEYVDEYVKRGSIFNCAGDGKCAYICRSELADAYACLLIQDKDSLMGKIHNLTGSSISQSELVDAINKGFSKELVFQRMTVDEYLADRKGALGEFIGTVITGIYDSMARGWFDVPSDFETVTGRPHKSVDRMIADFRSSL